MSQLAKLYRPSLALLTDLYQLTMACGYWKNGLAEWDAVFHLTFRETPQGSSYAIACGLRHAVDYLVGLRFEDDDLEYLQSLPRADGGPLFESGFLDYLSRLKFTCDVDAIPEGTAVFAHEPLVRVRGPLLQAQIVETPLLNLINFPTLIATKAARICDAAQGQPVLEFGLRRAQGVDGGITASRAAFIGGCSGTSNLMAGKLFDIPVRGTHAHSWVMTFADELQAFTAYADAMPGNCIFLVDTYDSLAGIRRAIQVAGQLRDRGYPLLGIRLDSGDLCALSITARKLLDEAGFGSAAVVASGDLDEHSITALRQAGAMIDIWGVGTRLVTAYDQPALGGVYKLAAVRRGAGPWQYKMKLSEQTSKSSDPGLLQVRRFRDADGKIRADVIYNDPDGIDNPPRWIARDPDFPTPSLDRCESSDLLVPAIRQGHDVYPPTSAAQSRARTQSQLNAMGPALRRINQPASYVVGWEQRLVGIRERCHTEAEAQTAKKAAGNA